MTVFFTADPHWGHEFVAKTRGFASAREHDIWLMDVYQAHFAPTDTVWWLGDLAVSNQQYGINSCIDTQDQALHHLVFGNHDKGHPMHRRAYRAFDDYRLFDSAQAFARRRFSVGTNRVDVLLSHFPYDGDHTEDQRYTQYRLRDQGMPLLHGHTHSDEKVRYTQEGTLQIHVGIDAWRRPVSLEDITTILMNA